MGDKMLLNHRISGIEGQGIVPLNSRVTSYLRLNIIAVHAVISSLMQAFADLIIVASRYNLLNGRAQHNRVLKLGRVRALLIAQRRIRFDDTRRDKVVQPQQILVVTESVKITSAKW
jgi:hypothetical protein